MPSKFTKQKLGVWFSFCLFQMVACTTVFAQGNSTIMLNQKKAKALVIGISSYQNIKSLKFADKDATEFAQFLRNSSGWKLAENDVLLLTNQSAKQGDILMGLQWLTESIQPGEEAVFYFSGHGDVETVGNSQQGFLLAHDSPKNNYPIGGTIGVNLLDSVFSEFLRRDIKVTIIIDACRSGQLAGGMSGQSHTVEELTKRWKNSIRILSAQPDQLSYENEKWGGGRGVFSYYLVKGMSGYADMNGDMKIFLSELEQYIGMNIAAQTDYTQQPVLDGPNKFSRVVSKTDEEFMSRYSDDSTEGELTVVLLTSKSASIDLGEQCNGWYSGLNAILESGLTRNEFYESKELYDRLNVCLQNDIPSQIRYQYMRNLINEINRIATLTLSGEKLVTVIDFDYGIDLIDELFLIHQDKRLLGKEHFENLRLFFKVLRFDLKEYDSSYEDLQVILKSNSIDADLEDLQQFILDLNLYDDYVPIDLKLDKTKKLSELKWRQAYRNYFGWFLDLKNNTSFLGDSVSLSIVFNRDTVVILGQTALSEVPKKTESYFDFSNSYKEKLSADLEESMKIEPDAAYLIYAKARIQRRKSLKNFVTLSSNRKVVNNYIQILEKSPKWLMPYYQLGILYEAFNRNRKALYYYEKILELDSVYRDFECLNCFYMSMINTYLKTGRQSEVRSRYLEWQKLLGNQDEIWEWTIGLTRDAHDDRFRKGEKYWLNELWETTDYSLDKQFNLLRLEIELKNRKFKDKEIFSFIREMVSKVDQLELSSYFCDSTNESRNDASCKNCTSFISKRFFPNEQIINVSNPKSIEIDLYNHLLEILYFMNEKKVFVSFDLLVETFYLESFVRNEDLVSYENWLESISFLCDNYDLRSTWKDNRNKGLDNESNFASTFSNDPSLFEYYENLLVKHIPIVTDLIEGRDIRKSVEFDSLKQKVQSYEDKLALDRIEILLDKILSKSRLNQN
jgi:hypothetical protein